MDSDNAGQGNQADRLAQLANLRRQGVLSDEEYEAAAARVVGAGSGSFAKHSTKTPTLVAPSHDLADVGRAPLHTPSTKVEDFPPEAPTAPGRPKASRPWIRGLVIPLAVAAALLVGGILFVALHGLSGANTQPLVGTWQWGGAPSVTMTFNSDGTWDATYVGSTPGDQGQWGSGKWWKTPPSQLGIEVYFVQATESSSYGFAPDYISFENGGYVYYWWDGSMGGVMTRS